MLGIEVTQQQLQQPVSLQRSNKQTNQYLKEIEIMKLWIGVYVKVFKEKGRRKAVKEKKRGEEKEKKTA